ncbi:MAG: hypothetical protein AAF629_21030 [Chloroflexota bacterium]
MDTRPSAALQKVQAALLAKRQALGIEPQGLPPFDTVSRPTSTSRDEQYQRLLMERRRYEARRHGDQASDTLKASLPIRSKPQTPRLPILQTPTLQHPQPDKTVKAYPTLLTAMLEHGHSATGRLYLLLRHLDKEGRGWLLIKDVRQQLTDKQSPLKLCGWRRLRQLLNRGEGLLWQRDKKQRIWLYSPAKMARKLSCGRLTGQPVAFPVKMLLDGIQAVRAHFYASYHSSKKINNPISRETLRQLTSVPERTQQEYDKVARVKKQTNLALGEKHTKEVAEQRQWRHGKATFDFIDTQGRVGKANQRYLAWRLPNSYIGVHQVCCKGRQKKINQRIDDLVMKGMQGNIAEQVDKLFWQTGAAAAQGHSKQPQNDAYWEYMQTRRKDTNLWCVIGCID